MSNDSFHFVADDRDRYVASVIIDQAEMNSLIADRLGIDISVVDDVMDLEAEFQVGVGIIDDPDHEFRYYDPATLANYGNAIVVADLAADAARFLDVPFDVAEAVLAAETDELADAGLVSEPDFDTDDEIFDAIDASDEEGNR